MLSVLLFKGSASFAVITAVIMFIGWSAAYPDNDEPILFNPIGGAFIVATVFCLAGWALTAVWGV